MTAFGRSSFFLVVSFFLITEGGVVFSQELRTREDDGSTAPSFVPGVQDFPADDSGDTDGTPTEDDGKNLAQGSLARDIETARREELLAWCRILDLDESGDIEALRRRLKDYYDIPSTPSAAGDEAAGGTRIVIESAKRSDYFTVDNPSGTETMIRLSGEVVLQVEEPGRNRSHRVTADTVLFNQERNTVSALGNIRYTVDFGGRDESFSGDSLIFTVDDWTGVIFRGTSSRTQDVEGTSVDFFFKGDAIRRSGRDVFILEKGTITSHDLDDPDYALRARKIWVTGPGEWGILDATLYIGRVPILYIPFYWKGGNDLIFNPAIGYFSREGYFIQTTTYLLGQKEASGAFSFLGFGDTAAPEYELTREGLYLIKGASVAEGERSSSDYIKFMADGYSSLGAFAGFRGEITEKGILRRLGFSASIGVSRSIDSTGNVFFVDDPVAGTPAVSYWNSSYWFGTAIPFRWGTTLDLEIPDWNLTFAWYSDPYYEKDFGNRKENFDWLSFVFSEEGTDINRPQVINDLNWEIRGSWRADTSGTSPWLSQLSMDDLRLSLRWLKKTNYDFDPYLPPPAPPLTPNPNLPADYLYNPAREFFYPDTLVLPDLLFSIRGNLPGLSVSRVEEQEMPEEAAEIAGIPEISAGPTGTGPEPTVPFESVTTVYDVGLLDASLGYGLNSQLFIGDNTLSETWYSPSDIDFGFEQAVINTSQRGNVDYGFHLWDNFTGIDGTTTMSLFWRTHADIFGSGAPLVPEVEKSDWAYNKILWDNRFSVYVRPLQGSRGFSESQFRYTFDANLFTRELVDGTGSSPVYGNSWLGDSQDFRTHEALGELIWRPSIFRFSATGTANIPPLSQRFVLKTAAGLDAAGFNVNFSQQTNYEGNTWTPLPVILNASWTGWRDEVTISQRLNYDPGPGRLTFSESTIDFWGFTTSLLAKYTTTYSWNQGNLEWDPGPDMFTPSELVFGYSREWSPKPMWKNRIGLKTGIDTRWRINLLQTNDNVLTFSFIQELSIFKFLDLRFKMTSINKNMYLYFEGWRRQLGITGDYNFFVDLFKSFNIFNTQDRYESRFNLERIDVSLIHHLRNWDASIEYSGWPTLSSGSYRWKSEFTFYIKWNPLPKVRQRVQYKDDDWSVDVGGSDS